MTVKRLQTRGNDQRLQIKVKTIDELINNNTVLQNDDELFLPVKANTRYYGRVVFLLETSAVAQLKNSITAPVGATGAFAENPAGTSINVFAFGTGTSSGAGGGAGITHAFILNFWITTGANGGNVQYQWAQNVAEISDTKVLQRSTMLLYEVGSA